MDSVIINGKTVASNVQTIFESVRLAITVQDVLLIPPLRHSTVLALGVSVSSSFVVDRVLYSQLYRSGAPTAALPALHAAIPGASEINGNPGSWQYVLLTWTSKLNLCTHVMRALSDTLATKD